MNCIVIDWDSFWINIIAGFILLIPSILISIWLIPKFTLRLMKKRNKKYSAIKIGAILQELSEFLIDSPFREKVSSFTRLFMITCVN
jgi:ABC-type transport system involved in cytochrome bd biosynthesis fused ATPase/permease subunit